MEYPAWFERAEEGGFVIAFPNFWDGGRGDGGGCPFDEDSGTHSQRRGVASRK